MVYFCSLTTLPLRYHLRSIALPIPMPIVQLSPDPFSSAFHNRKSDALSECLNIWRTYSTCEELTFIYDRFDLKKLIKRREMETLKPATLIDHVAATIS